MTNQKNTDSEQIERGKQALIQALSAEPRGDHPSDDCMIALAEGRLWPWQRYRIRRHLRQCAPCTAFAIELRRTEEAARELETERSLRASISRAGRGVVLNIAFSALAMACVLLAVRARLITPERLGDHSAVEQDDVRKGDTSDLLPKQQFERQYLNMKDQRPDNAIREMNELSDQGRRYGEANSILAIKSDALYSKSRQRPLSDAEWKLQVDTSRELAEKAKTREQAAQRHLESRK